jgi:phytoene synthase
MQTASFVPALDASRPTGSNPRIAPADLAACRALLANGSRTFLAASLLLPRSVRDPACALYAFCRVADDAIDGAALGAADDALESLRRKLDSVYRGDAMSSPVERAFQAVVHRFAIPRALPEALLEGFAWDASGRRYETLAELHDYAARVAGAVGAMMALVMNARSSAALARACDLGVAMQLSNIARDVGEDARAGRIYLPLAWLREAGFSADAWLAAPHFDPRLGEIVARLLEHAQALYARAGAGVAELPPGCRIGINAARFLYAEIGREVGRRHCNSIDSRAVVSPARKAALLAQAALCLRPRAGEAAAPLPATRYLVEAAAEPRPRRVVGEDGRAAWLIDLFARLERQDRLRHAGSAR